MDNLTVIAESLKTIGDVFYVLSHPIIIWDWLVDFSYWLVVIISLFCIIYQAVTEDSKFSRIMWISIVTFILIKGVNSVL